MRTFKYTQSVAILLGLFVGMGNAAADPDAVTDSDAATTPLVVEVEFIDVGDGKYCPSENNHAVSVANPPVGKPDRLVEFRGKPEGHKYSISFDPFSNKLYKSDADGVIKSNQLKLKKGAMPDKTESDPNQTLFQYKYSIYAKDCPTIDPIIIIDR